jgi:hypothetical protein
VAEKSEPIVGPPDAIEKRSLRFNYIKSRFFRVVHVDGAYGGLAGRGYITAALYNERLAIPQITEAQIGSDGSVSSEQVIESKQHVVREVEVELILDLPSARVFARWLNEKADALEQLLIQSGSQGND